MSRNNFNHNHYTEAQKKWLSANGSQFYLKKLTEQFNKEFSVSVSRNAIRHQCKIIGSPIKRKRYLKHYFKKGQSFNALPVGTEKVDARRDHVLIKIAEPNKWRYKHHIEWERHNGQPVPKGGLIVFLKDKDDYSKENLALVNQSELTAMNVKRFWKYPEQLRNSLLAIIKVDMKVKSLTKTLEEAS